MKEAGLFENTPYANSTQEVDNTRSLDVKSSITESPANGLSQQNGAVDGEGEGRLVNGYGNGDKNNKPATGYINGHRRTESGYSEKKRSLFRRLSLHK